MGQHFLIVNVTKKEYINPHFFGDGLKLGEQNLSIKIFNMLMINRETTKIFSVIKDEYDEYNFFTFPSNLLGSWKDDEIVFAGDNSKTNKYYELCSEYENEDMKCLKKDSYINIIDYFVIFNRNIVHKINFLVNKDKYYYYNKEKKECYVSEEVEEDITEEDNKNYILYLISDHENNTYSWNSNKMIVSETQLPDHDDYKMIIIEKEPDF